VAEVARMAEPFWTAGVDCGEERHRVVVLDEAGERRQEFWVQNRIDKIEEAVAKLVLSLPPGVKLRLVTETGHSLGGVLVRVAMGLRFEVWQANPNALAHYREVEGQPRKDDDPDAWLMARMCINRVAGCHLLADPRPEERTLSRLSRLHTQLQTRRTASFNRVRALLLELSPEVLSSSWEGPVWNGKGMLAVLTRWPSFDGLESARVSTVEKLLRSSTRYGSRCHGMAEALKEMAGRIRVDREEREVIKLELRLHIEDIRADDANLVQVDRQIVDRVTSHPVGARLLTMPGEGPFSAAVDIGEVLPIARNASEPKAATYSGLTPLSRISGKSQGRSRLARGVNKHALRANYLSAVSSLHCSALDSAYYNKQREQHQGHPKPGVAATISLARQRFKVKYKIMTTDAVYDKEILIASHLERERKRKQKKGADGRAA
jgi:transposase